MSDLTAMIDKNSQTFKAYKKGLSVGKRVKDKEWLAAVDCQISNLEQLVEMQPRSKECWELCIKNLNELKTRMEATK